MSAGSYCSEWFMSLNLEGVFRDCVVQTPKPDVMMIPEIKIAIVTAIAVCGLIFMANTFFFTSEGNGAFNWAGKFTETVVAADALGISNNRFA